MRFRSKVSPSDSSFVGKGLSFSHLLTEAWGRLVPALGDLAGILTPAAEGHGLCPWGSTKLYQADLYDLWVTIVAPGKQGLLGLLSEVVRGERFPQ